MLQRRSSLSELENAGTLDKEAWLYCVDRKRFQRVKDLREDSAGTIEARAFCEGEGIATFLWDWWRERGWPPRPRLHLGLQHLPSTKSRARRPRFPSSPERREPTSIAETPGGPMRDIHLYLDRALELGATIGLRIIGAILLFMIGRLAIKLMVGMTDKALGRRAVDVTVSRYLSGSVAVVLNVALAVAILGVFGVETTSFAAVLAAAGVAIGMAWSGLLGHFAAGTFLLILRPIRVGDFVNVGGVTGTVQSIGLFATALDTPDNVRTFVGNSKVFGEVIQNFSTNSHRRVDLVAQLAHGVDVPRAMQILRARVATIPNVLDIPAPVIELLESNAAGPVLAVRPFCANEHYWDVYFATNLAIREELGKAGFPVPEARYHIQLEQPVPVPRAA